jgi:hypothetical protein
MAERHKYRLRRAKALGNRLLMKWFIRSAIRYPGAALRAMKESIVDGYLANPLAGIALTAETPHLGKGCERLISRLFSLDKNAYQDLWQEHRNRNYKVLAATDRIAHALSLATHAVVLLALFLLPGCFMRRRYYNKNAFFLYVISLIYLSLFSLGNGYDARFSVVLNYCMFLALGLTVLPLIDRGAKRSSP